VYKYVLDGEDKALQKDCATLPKFSRRICEEGILRFADNPKQRKRLKEILEPNWVFPEYEQAPIDETLYKMMREGD
jgi:hypothetical protein